MFLEKFSDKVIKFIATNDQVIKRVEDKTARGMKDVVDKSKDNILQFRNFMTEQHDVSKARYEGLFEIM